MYSQPLALVALSAVGALAAPQLCACPTPFGTPSAGIPAAPGATEGGNPYQPAPSTVTSTITQYVTQTPTVPAASTETETVTSTLTVTATVNPTNTPAAPGTGNPYYPTYGGGQPGGVAGSTGVAPGSSSSLSINTPSSSLSPSLSNTFTPTPSAPGGSSSSTRPYSYPESLPNTPPTFPSQPTPLTPSAPATTNSLSAPTSYPVTSASDSVSAAASATGSASTFSPPSSTGAPTGASGDFPQQIALSNPKCFEPGNAGGGNKTITDSDGAAAQSSYQCYSGPPASFPDPSKWISYNDLKSKHQTLGQTYCSQNAPFNTDDQVEMIYKAIDAVGAASQVDKRVILTAIMQESSGCVNVPSTNNGVQNNGIMQSHDGASFVGNSASAEEQYNSIVQMISDGVQGTAYKSGGGDGLVQTLDRYANFYVSSRAYNSGDGGVDMSNLSAAGGATASYVSDTANYLQGWNGDSRGSCSF